eukprot:TRINITY_DN1913_c0_g1_i2.p2 TRINITY_DN1913_c0_g1~~TRINITY_DN1913_c0_g1_i2.p2  ORF type:complete len:156 (-),score=1.79 TRINITY_DN1913_c0_g1_i2:128-595(-)
MGAVRHRVAAVMRAVRARGSHDPWHARLSGPRALSGVRSRTTRDMSHHEQAHDQQQGRVVAAQQAERHEAVKEQTDVGCRQIRDVVQFFRSRVRDSGVRKVWRSRPNTRKLRAAGGTERTMGAIKHRVTVVRLALEELEVMRRNGRYQTHGSDGL